MPVSARFQFEVVDLAVERQVPLPEAERSFFREAGGLERFLHGGDIQVLLKQITKHNTQPIGRALSEDGIDSGCSVWGRSLKEASLRSRHIEGTLWNVLNNRAKTVVVNAITRPQARKRQIQLLQELPEFAVSRAGKSAHRQGAVQIDIHGLIRIRLGSGSGSLRRKQLLDRGNRRIHRRAADKQEQRCNEQKQ
jgi:hypothetical protein